MVMASVKKFTCVQVKLEAYISGLVVKTLDFGSNGFKVFFFLSVLGQDTLFSQSASLKPGVRIDTGEFGAGDNPAMVCRYSNSELCNLLVFMYFRNFTSKHSFSLFYYYYFLIFQLYTTPQAVFTLNFSQDK